MSEREHVPGCPAWGASVDCSCPPVPEAVECESCAAKPGSPDLCPSCLRNRSTVAYLRTRLAQVEGEREDAQAQATAWCDAKKAAEARCRELEAEAVAMRTAIQATTELADDLNSFAEGGAGFGEHWGERVLQAVEPLRNFRAFRDRTLSHNAMLLTVNSEYLDRATAAEARAQRAERALRLLWEEASDPVRGRVHVSAPCRDIVRAALTETEVSDGE